jgi:hypothetical protein
MAYKFNPLTGNLDDYGPVLTGTGTVSAAADGTAALPGIAFTNDLNTGIYRPGADQLALSTNGDGRLFVNSDGSIQFGNPSATRLQVAATSAIGDSLYSYSSNYYIWGFRNESNSLTIESAFGGNIIFKAKQDGVASSPGAATERLRITSTGQLSHIGAGSSGSPAVSFNGSAPSNSLVIDSSGRVGLGTSSPGATLHIEGLGNTVNQRIFTSDNVLNATASLTFGTTPGTRSKAALQMINVNTGNGAGALALQTNDGTTLATRLYIADTGRVGIGTSTARAQTEISRASAPTSTTIANSYLQLGGSESGASSYRLITFGGVGESQAPAYIGYLQTSTTASTLGDLVFGTRSTTINDPPFERARITSSGQLLVGTNSTSSVNRLIVQSSSDAPTGAGTLLIARGDNAPLTTNVLGALRFGGSTHVNSAEISAFRDGGTWTAGSSLPTGLTFSTTADGAASPTERMRINSVGKILIGQTSTYAACDGWLNVTYTSASTAAPTLGLVNASATAVWVSFSDSATVFGSITRSGSSTVYATSSDYRLKENVAPVTDGITRLQQLKPSRFNFIADPDKTVDGFIAHEVQTIVPEAITGEKDAVDDEGNPVYQGIDQSKLVPLLTAALQEAIGEIESLKARVAALEAS